MGLQLNDYNIPIKVLGNIRFREVPSRVVYEYYVCKLQHSYCLQIQLWLYNKTYILYFCKAEGYNTH